MGFIKSLGKGFAMLGGGICGGMIYYLPNTVFLDKVKKTVQLYQNATTLPVPSEVVKLSKVVMNDMKLTEEDQEQIEFFNVPGFGFYHAGSIKKTKYVEMKRAIIGIPVNLHGEMWERKFKNNIIINGESIEMSSEEGQILKKSLTLSEKAKKFAIAQQLYYISSYEVLAKSGITGLLLFFFIVYCSHLRDLSKGKVKRTWPIYLVLAISNFALWLFVHDGYTCYLEGKMDEALADLRKEYLEGGLEFYENVLNVNIALRNIAEKREQNLYTLYGNEKELLRTKHLPLTSRRDYFKNRQT